MKSVLLLAVVIIFSINLINAKTTIEKDETSSKRSAAFKLCATKFNITMSDFKVLYGVSKPKEIPHNLQCFEDCTANELGLIKNGVIQDVNVINDTVSKNHNRLTNDEASNIIKKCKDQVTQLKSTDNCVNSYTFKKCTTLSSYELSKSKLGTKAVHG